MQDQCFSSVFMKKKLGSFCVGVNHFTLHAHTVALSCDFGSNLNEECVGGLVLVNNTAGALM